MHASARAFVAATVARYRPRPPILEIGSRDINGGIRDLFGAPYVGVDLRPGRGVDVVGDVRTVALPFVPRTVVCCEVLEHTPDAEGLIRWLGELLAPGGGWLVLTCATVGRIAHSGVDGGKLKPGEFYRNYTPGEVVAWATAAGFALLETVVDPGLGDLYVVGHTDLRRSMGAEGIEPSTVRV